MVGGYDKPFACIKVCLNILFLSYLVGRTGWYGTVKNGTGRGHLTRLGASKF